jgi:hypothetical protein
VIDENEAYLAGGGIELYAGPAGSSQPLVAGSRHDHTARPTSSDASRLRGPAERELDGGGKIDLTVSDGERIGDV